MRTPRAPVLSLLTAAVLLGAAPAGATAAGWKTTGFPAGSDELSEPVPRAAKEPVAMPLSGGRVLTTWSGVRGIGAALAGPDGSFKTTAEPKGPPPRPFHTNSTNRDLRTAGRYAIFTWARDGRVRVAVRRF